MVGIVNVFKKTGINNIYAGKAMLQQEANCIKLKKS